MASDRERAETLLAQPKQGVEAPAQSDAASAEVGPDAGATPDADTASVDAAQALFETLAAHSSELVYGNTVPSLRAAELAAGVRAPAAALPAHTLVLEPPKPASVPPTDGDSGLFGGFASAPPEALRPRISRVPTQRSKDAAAESLRGVDRTDPLLGRCLAEKYTLTRLLGQGAMGQVYRGVHEALGTPIAVKVMRRSVAGDPVYRRRFSREARAASMLAHPNAVRVLDYGEDSGMPFIVMEFVEGQDLDTWLSASVSLPSLKLVGFIADQILSALQAAHDLGIVHRDLKPENVMLCRGAAAASEQDLDLCAKVSDFGLAHVEDPRDNLPTLTQRDAVAGTPSFMSPEQCRSLAVGPSTDLYAFGCLLTCMLQGGPPFEGSSPIDVISKQMFAEPPPLERPAELEPVPPLLERLRLELLAKKAHKRPATAAETRRRLKAALNADTNRALVPDRKGEVPLGARAERAGLSVGDQPAETGSAEAAGAEQPQLLVALVQLPQGSGCDAALRMGLTAQAVSLTDRPSEFGAAELVLLDAQRATQAVEWLSHHPPTLPVVVSLPTVDTAGINSLIAAGAREVVTQPLESGSLARRLRRAVRRGRR